MSETYLKAKYKITSSGNIKYIVCQTNKNTFYFFKEESFEKTFKQISFVHYSPIDYVGWNFRAREILSRILDKELKPF
jgi:hypothetical protein